MEGLGRGAQNAIIFALAAVAYLTRRDYVLMWLSNDRWRLGFVEGTGLSILVFGQVSKFSRSLFRMVSAIRHIINEKA